MKKGWEIKTLGEICEVLDSKRKPITKRDRTAGEYPYYGATGILDYVHEFIFDEKLVLIGEDGAKWEAGEYTAFIAEGKYWVNNHAHVIRPNREVVLDEWIVYFLYVSDLHKYVTGLTVPKLNQEKMRSIQIPLPPLPEQERIVSLLDESFAALAQVHANAARNLVNAREVFEGVLEQEFQNAKENHISKNITELCEIGDGNHGGNYPKKSDMRQSGVPFIRSVNLVNGHISDIDMRFISKEKHKSLKKGHLKTGDVLFTNRGEMGKSAVVDARYDDANLNSQIAFFRCSEQILPWYLYHILQSPFMQEHSTKSQTGAALQQLPIGIISKFEIPLPPLAEQRAIVQRLDGLARETRRLEEVYRQKVEDVEELRKSILKEQLSMDN
ncbi:MAG: restriction endonuclease subunit S [Anaerolineales bacterium]|nr:restriction endonuclease subunit S [Anaerolineales bacterium]